MMMMMMKKEINGGVKQFRQGWNFDIYILCYTVLGGEDGATWLSVVV